MRTRELSMKEAFQVFFCKDNYERCRIDGVSPRDWIRDYVVKGYRYVGSLEGDTIIGITAFRPVGENDVEVHTYVPKDYRKRAVETLKNHIAFFRMYGFTRLITYTATSSKSVENFLMKRLYFIRVTSHPTTVMRDGKEMRAYKLFKDL